MSPPEHLDWRFDVIERLARIEEGVAGTYPRLDKLEQVTERLEAWRVRLVGFVAAAVAFFSYLGHDKLSALIAALV